MAKAVRLVPVEAMGPPLAPATAFSETLKGWTEIAKEDRHRGRSMVLGGHIRLRFLLRSPVPVGAAPMLRLDALRERSPAILATCSDSGKAD